MSRLRNLAIVCALLAWVIVSAPTLVARRALSLVDDVYSPALVNDNAITLTNVQSGDVVMVIGAVYNTTQTLTVSDEDGHTWSECPTGTIDNAGAAVRGQGRYVTATSNITTITLTSSGAANTAGGAVVYRGMGTISCDASGSDDDDGVLTHGAAISVSPSTTNDTVMFGGFATVTDMTLETDPPGAPSGYTEVGTTLTRAWAGYKVVNSTSANGFTTVTENVEDSVSLLMAIKSDVAAAAGGCGRFSLLGVGC
jgi:hypothetical protein